MIIATSLKTYLSETSDDLLAALSLAKNDGFQAMGIVMTEHLEYYLRGKNFLLESGLKFCIHTNLVDTNLASSNEGIRKESIKQLKDSILLAKELNTKVVTFHPGKYQNSYHVQEAYFLLDQSLQEAILFAKKNDVTICLENMEPNGKELCVTLSQVQRVLDRHPLLMLTLDFAHVAMLVQSEEELLSYFTSLRPRIRHLHISGVKPNKSHVEVSLKESDVDFTNVISLLNDFDGILRIENRERQKNIESMEFIKQAQKSL